MKKYTADIIQAGEKHEHLCRIEFDREWFTSREYKMITNMMFFLAAQGIENSNLIATVTCGGLMFTIHADTVVDGSTIWTDIGVAHPFGSSQFVRRMEIAS